MELHRHGLAGRGRDRAWPDRTGRRPRHPAGRHQRLLLRRRPTCTKRTTRCCASPRAALLSEQDRRRVTPEHWFKPAADDARAVRRPAGSLRQHPRHRPTLRGHGGNPQAAAAGLPEGASGRDRGRNRPRHGDRGPGAPHGRTSAPTRRRAQVYRERLDYELDVIASMGFSGYFLIVADFIQWSKAQGIPVGPGRGSGAGSVAAWALTITDLDPLRFNLLFERFLNPERVSMPDFDIDFCQEGRDRGHRLCAQRIRRRPGRADHHLRKTAGPRRGARRRPRAGHAVRPGQPRRRTDPQQSRQAGDVAAGGRWRTAAAGPARPRTKASAA